MNNIQEKDWAEEDWHSHTGIDSSCDYCVVDGPAGETKNGQAGEGECHPDGRAEDGKTQASTA